MAKIIAIAPAFNEEGKIEEIHSEDLDTEDKWCNNCGDYYD